MKFVDFLLGVDRVYAEGTTAAEGLSSVTGNVSTLLQALVAGLGNLTQWAISDPVGQLIITMSIIGTIIGVFFHLINKAS